MLSAEAYSFQLKSRLAISLSWIAGYTNVVALIVTGHVVSHATGNATFLGLDAGQRDWPGVLLYAFLLATFFAGAVASALMTEGARRRGMPSKYILPMAVEAVLLVAFGWGVEYQADTVAPTDLWQMYWLSGVASFAMGLQNATITRISGAVVRTTHLTGVVTDLGLEGVQFLFWYRDKLRVRRSGRLGRVLRVTRRHPSFQRLLLLASIVGSFVFGVVIGAIVFGYWPEASLVPPVAFLLWIILMDWRHPIADVRELDLLADRELNMLGIVRALLPPELGIYRLWFHKAGEAHAAPNFLQWAERLPKHWRVVIVAMSPLTHLDEEALLNLQAALRRLTAHHRQLVIASVTPAQYKALEAGHIVDDVGPANVCTDLEFAIARGIDLVAELKGLPPVRVAR